MKTRQMQDTKVKVPRTATEWDSLAAQAIRRAETVGDQRVTSLRNALQEGKSEKILRMFGVISEADLLREFPASG